MIERTLALAQARTDVSLHLRWVLNRFAERQGVCAGRAATRKLCAHASDT